MYIRFQTREIDDDSKKPKGFLVAAHELRDSDKISLEEESWLRNELDYFNTHLKVPQILSEDEHFRALSWFKPESKMISKVWDIVSFLQENGIHIEVLKTDNPGTIIYSDGHQVVAKPKRKK